jgi:hypothetical protein
MTNNFLFNIRLFVCLFVFGAFASGAHAQTATLSATSVTFGNTPVGSSSATKSVTLTNSSRTALAVTSVSATGPFTQTNTCGTSVAAGKNCRITISFIPTAVAAQAGSVVVADNAATATQTISLSGTGTTPIALSPASHGFGNVGEGVPSAPFSFTVKNSSTTPMPLTVSLTGPFAQVSGGTCGASVAGSSSCTIAVSLDPTTAGAQTGTLSVSAGVGNTLNSNLTGTGVVPVSITPASRSFGSVIEGLSSDPKLFTIKNSTAAAMPLTYSSTNPEFTYSGCPASLTAGASCSLSVTFKPTATSLGLQTGTLSVNYTGIGGPLSVAVQGTATSPLNISPTSISFSTTRNVGTASTPHTVTIINLSPSSVALGPIVAAPSAYAITSTNCGATMAGFSTCTVTLVFTPTVTGTTTGTLTIPYGGGNQSVVSLMGGAQVSNLRSIAITMPNPSLPSGSTEQLVATGSYSGGTTGNLTSVAVWTSSNTGVGTIVSNSGSATGVNTGTTTITATVTETNGTVVTGTATLSVAGKAITGITITGTQGSTTPLSPPTLAAGSSLQVFATATYFDGSTADITGQATWASSGGGAAVTGGLITTAATGDPTITASLSGMTGATTVTVTPATLQSITITPPSISLAAGNTEQYTATGTYSDKTTQNITSSVTWTSSLPGVTMSTTTPGLATTSDAAIGTNTNITASLGGVTSPSSVLTVNAAALVSIAVTPASPSITNGTTEAFTATGTYSDGTSAVLTAPTWMATTLSGGTATFPNPSTTTTNLNVATATAPGTVTITATSGTVSGSTILTVTAPTLVSIVVTTTPPANPPQPGAANANLNIYQGQTQQFYAVGNYSDSSVQNLTATVAWSTSTASMATVSTAGATAGLATAVGAGSVQVLATSGSIVGSGTLNVIGLTSIAVTPTTPTVALDAVNPALAGGPTNDTLQFVATATYADSTTAIVTTGATWTAVTASGTSNVASMSTTTPGLATVLAVGTSTVTATYSGVSGSTLLNVTAAVLESITVSPTGVTLGLNGTQQFTATGNYSDGTTADLTNTATWTSFTPADVTVSSTGLATVIATPSPNVAVAIMATSGPITTSSSANTAFVSTSTTLPIVCTAPTIAMQLLVVNNAGANNGAGYADFPAIQQILNYVGTPYTVVDVSGPAPVLSSGCGGNYQGVIFAYGGDYYSIPTWQAALISYEQTFGVRQLNWFDTGDPNFGLSTFTNMLPSTATYTTNFTPSAASVFFYANTGTPLTITNAAVYETNADPAAGGTLTPLLQDAAGNIVSATYSFQGQQFLTQTFDSNPFLTHDLVVAYGLLNWVTKGVFLGDYHVYATQQIDDFFIDDSEWIPGTVCLANPQTLDRTAPDASNLPVTRVSSNDMSQLAAWQSAKQADPLLSPGATYETTANSGKFELTLAMNGVGTTGNGDWTGLVAPIIASSANGGVVSFTAQDFAGQVGDTVTITGTTNGGGVLNSTYTITSVNLSAATTPSTNTFTVTNSSVGTLSTAKENGVNDGPGTAQATVADSLTANFAQYQQYFHWISHTYDHPSSLNGLCQSAPAPACGNTVDTGDNIDLEILTNNYVASAPGGQQLDTDTCTGGNTIGCDTVTPLAFSDFNPQNIVTPGVTGLNDTNVPAYLYNDGIRYAVSDTSVATITSPPNNNGPNPSPNVGIINSYAPGIYEVPRHPNDVFYNASNWADDQAEFDCVYTYYVPPDSPPGTVPAADPPFNTYNAAQILDFTSSAFVTNMLMGDMDPQMFHQPDLHFSDNYANLTNPAPSGTIPASITAFLAGQKSHVSSLISDTYDLTFSKYEALYKLPVLTPTLDQMALLMQNRNAYNQSRVTASIVNAGTPAAAIMITMPTGVSVPSAIVPVTGVTSTGSESYGGQNISHISMVPGQTITILLP